MITKGDQRSWITIEVVRGKNTSECNQGLWEAWGENTLWHKTPARWIKTFRVGWNETSDLHYIGQSSFLQCQIDIGGDLLSTDRRSGNYLYNVISVIKRRGIYSNKVLSSRNFVQREKTFFMESLICRNGTDKYWLISTSIDITKPKSKFCNVLSSS